MDCVKQVMRLKGVDIEMNADRITIDGRVAKLKWQWAGPIVRRRNDVGDPRCSNGRPAALVSAAMVDSRRGDRTTLGTSQVAAGFKRHKTVEFGTPYKRPMSSSMPIG
ncbi:jg3120 [Pararge aegeria aegeria]|uniref:Jg3120 protein n=1 Tax=Pararge aegeria aegeria TaxID=348720 RepID=A0A8S4RCB1_9NEOP|nr:jg3120 [Pararge aegeria aegeria]